MCSLDNARDYERARTCGITNNEGVKHMDRTARHRVLQFLAARFRLLNLFVNEARKCETGLLPDHRLLWVLLQAIPTHDQMLSKDAFQEIASALRGASIEDLEWQIGDMTT